MQKLSYVVLNKLIERHVTSAEIDVLLYVSRYQNTQGVAEGMYYKDVCEDLDISYQTFYDAKDGLVSKGIIAVDKINYFDNDIKILDNDFSDSKMYQKGYINTNHELFACKQFRMMKAGAKLLAMDLMKNNLTSGRSYHCNTKNFHETFMRKLDICKRTLQHYMKELKLLFYIGVKDRQYWIKIRAFAEKRQSKNENQKYRENSINVAIRRNRIKKEKVRKEDVTELDNLLKRYNREISDEEVIGGVFSLSKIIENSIKVINAGKEKKMWKRSLKPTLVHRILRKTLGMDVRDLPYDIELV